MVLGSGAGARRPGPPPGFLQLPGMGPPQVWAYPGPQNMHSPQTPELCNSSPRRCSYAAQEGVGIDPRSRLAGDFSGASLRCPGLRTGQLQQGPAGRRGKVPPTRPDSRQARVQLGPLEETGARKPPPSSPPGLGQCRFRTNRLEPMNRLNHPAFKSKEPSDELGQHLSRGWACGSEGFRITGIGPRSAGLSPPKRGRRGQQQPNRNARAYGKPCP